MGKKVFVFSSALIVFALIVGGAYLYLNFNILAKNAIEKVASNTLGVPVTIASLDISLEDKRIKLQGLRVANPGNFKTEYAVIIDDINIAVESISTDKLVFDQITVNGKKVNLEVTPNGTNLTMLRDNAMRSSKREYEEEYDDDDYGEVKVIINDLMISESSLTPTITLAEMDLGTVVVPRIHMTGIGQSSNGILVSEAISLVLEEVVDVTIETAANSGFLQGMSKDVLKDIGVDKYQGLTDKIGSGVGRVGVGIRGVFED